MRIRSIKPEFCTDEKIGALTREARLHFILLWMTADRHGVVEYRPRQLAAMMYPFDEDMENSRFEALTSEVLQQSLCSHFSHDGRQYLFIRNFTKHQALTTWERKESRPAITMKSLQKYFNSPNEISQKTLFSEERRGEESTEPPNPQGGLSVGEVPFQSMLEVIVQSGKGPAGLAAATLAHFWRSVPPGSDPNDPGWLEELRHRLAGQNGKIGQVGPWLLRRAGEYFENHKNGGATALSQLGPSAGEH